MTIDPTAEAMKDLRSIWAFNALVVCWVDAGTNADVGDNMASVARMDNFMAIFFSYGHRYVVKEYKMIQEKNGEY